MPSAEEGRSHSGPNPDSPPSDPPLPRAATRWRRASSGPHGAAPAGAEAQPPVVPGEAADASALTEPEAEAPAQPFIAQLTSSHLARLLVELGVGLDLATAISMSSPTVRVALEHVLACVPSAIGVVQPAVVSTGADDLALRSVPASSAANPADGASRSPRQSAAAPVLEASCTAGVADSGQAVGSAWNTFQRRMAGAGLTRAQAAQLYGEEQQALRQQCLVPHPRPDSAALAAVPATPSVHADRMAAVGASPAPAVMMGHPPVVDSGPSRSAAVPLELGYLAVRLPPSLAHLRGHHRCSWASMLQRFNVSHQQWLAGKSQLFTPRFVDQASAQATWVAQGLRLPIPVAPGVGTLTRQ